MTEQEKYSRLILANTQGVGPTFFKKVLNDYQSINSFLQDNSSTLYKKVKHKLGIAKSACSEIDTNSFVVYGEANYPINLLNIADAPLVLFYKGRIEIINQRRNIAVVGTRNCTSYG
ncbi:DNA-processing protein DprA, partial [Candidatus Dojkabacteria bacterium]|nr:DNA-processing protein DprA [Candidatus Dojkabacteria bacterium]